MVFKMGPLWRMIGFKLRAIGDPDGPLELATMYLKNGDTLRTIISRN